MKWIWPLALLFGCTDATSSRYRVEADLGSRYNFKYVRDTESGKWANRDCELRVAVARKLPDTGPSAQLFRPGSAQTAGMSADHIIREGYRVWAVRDVIRPEDLGGGAAYGVQIAWRQEGRETQYETMEVFRIAPLGNTPPYTWSDWFRASDSREGAFGWWEETHGKPKEPPPQPEHPFEMRCRITLDEVPGVIRETGAPAVSP